MNGERRFRVAVVGATGLVGGEIVSLLAERSFPVSELVLFATERSRGETLEWEGESVEVQEIDGPLPEVDIAFLCASAEISAAKADELAAAGALVIDLAGSSGALALTAGDARSALPAAGAVVRIPDPVARLIAVPVQALRPLADPVRVIASVVVSASRSGRASVERLSRETIRLLNLDESEEGEEPTVAFRCTPLARRDAADAVTRQLGDLLGDELPISLAVVRAPIFHGQIAEVAIQFAAPIDAEAARARLRDTPSLLVADEGSAPVSSLDALADDAMHVARIECSADDPTWLRLSLLGDNVRQGAALAAVSLAEGLLLRH